MTLNVSAVLIFIYLQKGQIPLWTLRELFGAETHGVSRSTYKDD